jgi:TldD protein
VTANTALRGVDPAFLALALELESTVAAALERASAAGAEFADVRVMASTTNDVSLHDRELQSAAVNRTLGIGIRVLMRGSWGFSATTDLAIGAVIRATTRALALARTVAVGTHPVTLAAEASHRGSWCSGYVQDPTAVDLLEVVDTLDGWTSGLLASQHVDHVDASFTGVKEQVLYANSEGTRVVQQRVRCHPSVTAMAVSDEGFEDMTTTGPPAARGWEYALSPDWHQELALLPNLLAERVAAPDLEPGRYDLVIDPTNLWLTIHESVGHATEYDRAIGLEANYAGTSFAVPSGLGSFRYGSRLMNISGDRTTPDGLATVQWDDEGVAAQRWDIVRDGVLVGYQLDRAGASTLGLDRSNGCAYADSAGHVQLQRMPNVSLAADSAGGDLDSLIAGVTDGVLVVGDKSWSIDMARHNFQFTAQRFLRIRAGQLVGQVKGIAYQSTTPEFWRSLVALGGPDTYRLGGALNCGKGQPGQVAAVSHGCAAAVFEGVNVLTTGDRR